MRVERGDGKERERERETQTEESFKYTDKWEESRDMYISY